MPQPPAYNRTKDFTENFGSETDHTSINAELDAVSNSINTARVNLALMQADDGKIKADAITIDSLSQPVMDQIINEASQGVVTYTNQANASAAEALTSQNAAAAAQTSAATSATNASASETAAASSASSASTSATNAATSATTASNAATTATTKASEAATSATTATTKAGEASTSAATATTKAGEASTSATNAATSATTASTAATNAGNSATAAATSEANAATSASAAAASAATLANANLNFRNKIINGGMMVAQRASAGWATNGVATYGGCDRIYGYTTGFATISGGIEQSTAATTLTRSGYSQRIAVSSTGTGVVNFGTRLESKDVKPLNGKSVTVQAKIRHTFGAGVTAQISLYKANAADVFSATTLIASSSGVAVSTATDTTLQATFALGATDASNGLMAIVSFLGVGAVTSQSAYIGEWQIEEGTVATPFEHRPIGVETSLCHRYAQLIFGTFSGFSINATTGEITIPLMGLMRAVPTLTNITNGVYVDGVGAAAITGVTASNSYANGPIRASFTSSGMTALRPVSVVGQAVLLTAEL